MIAFLRRLDKSSNMATLSENETRQICDLFNFTKLEDFQSDSIYHLLNKKDVFLSVKTGGGKSIVYQSFRVLHSSQPEHSGKCQVVVVTPLLSIMKEQCEFLDSLGFKATYIGRDGSDESSILQGEHDFLFTSPENILGNCKWRDMVTSSSSIHLIVVDEAHTVLQWGETVTDDEPFRAWYGKLGEIRSLISCPVLLITATANKAARMKLQQKFCMKGCHEIISNPDRSNIKLFVHKYKSSMPLNILLNFLVEKVTTEKGLCDRYIIFCPSIKLCSEVFTMFRMELGSDIKHVQMYHSKTTDEVKEHIKSDMGKVNGDVRLLVATSAAGMGVNFIGVNQVINLGPPKSMDSFLQQFGRAGRDGSQSMAMLLYSGRQCTNIDDDVKCYIQNDTICRRKVVLEAYNAKPSLLEKHLCCDICQNNCTCGGENCSNFEHAFHSQCNEDSFSESSSDSSLESSDSDT